MPREINSVAVAGGGLMRAGIAEVSAVAGMPVVVRDLPQFLDAALTFTPDPKDVASADIMIEAVPEILDLKVPLIKELDELVSSGNMIGTNTSSIPIAELAGQVQHPGRVAGVHFFSPVPVMKLVEIVIALDTDPETADTAFAFAAPSATRCTRSLSARSTRCRRCSCRWPPRAGSARSPDDVSTPTTSSRAS